MKRFRIHQSRASSVRLLSIFAVVVSTTQNPAESFAEEASEDEGISELVTKAVKVVERAAGGTKRIPVTVRTEKTEYRRGENLNVFVKTAQAVHLRLFYRDASGDIVLLFPNRFHPDSRIAGGREIAIPDGEDGFDIEIVAPFGKEQLAAVVSDRPFRDEAKVREIVKKEGFAGQSGKDLVEVVSKAARVRARPVDASDKGGRLGVDAVEVTTRE